MALFPLDFIRIVIFKEVSPVSFRDYGIFQKVFQKCAELSLKWIGTEITLFELIEAPLCEGLGETKRKNKKEK